MRTWLKQEIMIRYHLGRCPAWLVRILFAVFRLKHA